MAATPAAATSNAVANAVPTPAVTSAPFDRASFNKDANLAGCSYWNWYYCNDPHIVGCLSFSNGTCGEYGVDVPLNAGTPIYAPESGTIATDGPCSPPNYSCWVPGRVRLTADAGDAYPGVMGFGHVKFQVSSGHVSAGQEIATVADQSLYGTGWSNHVEFMYSPSGALTQYAFTGGCSAAADPCGESPDNPNSPWSVLVALETGSTSGTAGGVNFLQNASFQVGSGGSVPHWVNSGGSFNWNVYTSGDEFFSTPEGDPGGHYLEFNAAYSAAWVQQEIPVSLSVGQSYTFSTWVRADTTVPENVCVVLYGTNGPTSEFGQTCRTVGSTWTLISAPYDVTKNGLTDVVARVVLNTPNQNLDMTGTQLVNDFLQNASFQVGSGGSVPHWVNSGGSFNWNVYTSGDEFFSTPEGDPGGHYLEFNAAYSAAWVQQEIPVSLSVGQSYTFSTWVRADTTVPENVCVVLYGTNGPTSEFGQTCRTVGSTWTLISAPYDVTKNGLTDVVARVVLNTPNQNLDMTGTSFAAHRASVPDQPTSVVGTAGNAEATIHWAAPASDGGLAVDSYTVTASPGGATTTVTGNPPASHATVTGLTKGTAYTFKVTANNAMGTGPASAASNAVTPGTPPTITSSAATTFAVGKTRTFTVTSTGSPTAVLSETGALPTGVTFHSNGNGTATLSGAPAAEKGGKYPIVITAKNGVHPNGTQNFTLTVNQAPVFTSATTTTFTHGIKGTFHVSAVGPPTPGTITSTGTLPSGVTFSSTGGGIATLTGTAPLSAQGMTFTLTFVVTNAFGTTHQTFKLAIN